MWGEKLLAEVESPINGKIQVIKFLGKPRIIVNNLLQSGGMIELIWKKGVKVISNQKMVISNCLILGLGGGSAVNLINQYFPKAKITTIEIDPIMIKLGKKYFDLDKIKNLKIIINDALKTITNDQLPIAHYNLILVDLYLGHQFPPQAESPRFLKSLKKILTRKGRLIFNRLFYEKHKKSTEEFIRKLEPYFSKIELIRAWSNLLVVCLE
jgi:spermidine synthase